MNKTEKAIKIAENVRKHTERYGFPTKPIKAKDTDNKKK